MTTLRRHLSLIVLLAFVILARPALANKAPKAVGSSYLSYEAVLEPYEFGGGHRVNFADLFTDDGGVGNLKFTHWLLNSSGGVYLGPLTGYNEWVPINHTGWYYDYDTIIKIKATDRGGLSTTRTIHVSVSDTTPPVFVRSPNSQTVKATSDQGAEIVLPQYDFMVDDNADPYIYSSVHYEWPGVYHYPDSTFPRLFPIGTTTIRAIATDYSGNMASVTFTVTVEPSQRIAIEPTVASPMQVTANLGAQVRSQPFVVSNIGEQPLTINAVTLSGANPANFTMDTTGMATTVPAGGSTNFTVFFQSATPGTFSAAVNVESDGYNVTPDGAGKRILSSAIIGTTKTNTAPVLTVPESPVVFEATQPGGAVVNFDVSVTDEGEATLPVPQLSKASGTLFPLGDTVVTASVMDSSGLTNSKTFTVTVRDTTRPAIVQPSNINTPLTQDGGAVINFPLPTIMDAVGVVSTQFSPPSGSLLPSGLNTITLTAKDAAGNSSSTTFDVSVGVRFQLPPSPLVVEAQGPTGAVVNFSPTVDPAGQPTTGPLMVSPASGSLFPIGDTTVTVSATDSSGFPSVKTFVVSVRDTTPPQIAIADVEVFSASQSEAVTFPTPTATDAVGVQSITFSRPSGTAFPVGRNIVAAIAKDAAGNAGHRLFIVNVKPQRPIIEVEDGRSWLKPLETRKAEAWGKMDAWLVNTYGTGYYSIYSYQAYSAPATLGPDISNAVAIACGGAHTLALQPDGKVVAWGQIDLGATPNYYNSYSYSDIRTADVPSSLVDVVAIAAGTNHSLALKRDGTVVTWGRSYPVPEGLKGVVAIAAGQQHSLALKADGTVVAWGDNYYGQTNVPASLRDVTAIATGDYFGTALKADGTLTNLGSWWNSSPPDGLDHVMAVSCQGYTSLALKDDGTVATWGSYAPPVPADLSNVIAVEAGPGWGLALKRDGTPVTWGSNSYGQLDIPTGVQNVSLIAAGDKRALTIQETLTPNFIDLGVLQVGSSQEQRIRISNPSTAPLTGLRTVFTSTSGDLTVSPLPSSTLAAESSIELTVRYAASKPGMGNAQLLVYADTSAQAYCDFRISGTAWSVPDLSVEDSTGAPITRAAGHAVAWGRTIEGQTSIPAGTNIVSVAAGNYFSLSLEADGTVAYVGPWSSDGTLRDRTKNVRAISARGHYALAVTQTGELLHNHDGTGYPSGFLAPPADLANVHSITMGDRHSVALLTDGTVTVWGANDKGQRNVPAGLSGVMYVVAAATHTLALKADGTVVAWGQNSDGAATVPAGLANVVAINTNARTSAARMADGTTIEWGYRPAAASKARSTVMSSLTMSSTGSSTISIGTGISYWNWTTSNTLTFAPTSIPRPTNLTGIVQEASGIDHTIALTMALPAVSFGTANSGEFVERTFTIRSAGSADLHSVAASINGTHASQYSIVGPALPSRLAVGETAQLRVRFTPTGIGARSARLRIASNDPNENPFEIDLNATAASPEIGVYPSEVAFGIRVIGRQTSVASLSISNTGTSDLTGLGFTIGGPDAAQFAITTPTPTSIAAGGKSTISISFTPQTTGTVSASLKITSNDEDESVVVVPLSGRGSAIDLSLIGGNPIDLNSSVWSVPNYMNETVDTGSQVERSFTFHNSGATPLTGLRLEIVGYDDDQLTITPPLPSRLEPGESVTLTVRFSALLGGWSRGAQMRLLTDSAGESPVNMGFYPRVKSPRLEVTNSVGVVQNGNPSKAAVAWTLYDASNASGQLSVPQSLVRVARVAANMAEAIALTQDGKVVTWGYPYWLSYRAWDSMPFLRHVTNISAAKEYALALQSDGTVAGWGRDVPGTTSFPATLRHIQAISAGYYHSLALTEDGNVIAWGDNGYGQTSAPAGLTDVVAIAAGETHSLALKRDGTVVAWGGNGSGQSTVPAQLTDVVAINAGRSTSIALKRDGKVVAWGYTVGLQTMAVDGRVEFWFDDLAAPTGIQGLTSICTSGMCKLAVADPLPVAFPTVQLGQTSGQPLQFANRGDLVLNLSQIVLEGPDADQFSLTQVLPDSLLDYSSVSRTLRFKPTRVGPLRAQLKMVTNDPATPDFALNLYGFCNFTQAATKAGSAGNSSFTYGPLARDPQTGLLLQKLTFTNTTGVALNGLRVKLTKFAPGVVYYSSSPGAQPDAVDVLYSKPIAAGETVVLSLICHDPVARAPVTPVISAEALPEPEPRLGPVAGVSVPLLSLRDTTNGPLLEWNGARGKTYVVEYSDDGGKTWFSAVHRLAGLPRMMWVDRGQPETYTKPVNKSARSYRVRSM